MNIFELKTENTIANILHKILLSVGILSIIYLFIKAFDLNLKKGKPFKNTNN